MTPEEHQLLQLVDKVHTWLSIALRLQITDDHFRAIARQVMMSCDRSEEEGNPRLRAIIETIKNRVG